MGLAEALVHDWVEHHGKPRMLVLEASNVANVNDVVGELLPYWIYSERLRAISETEQPRTAAVVGASHLFVFNCELFLQTLYYVHRSDQDWVNRYRMPLWPPPSYTTASLIPSAPYPPDGRVRGPRVGACARDNLGLTEAMTMQDHGPIRTKALEAKAALGLSWDALGARIARSPVYLTRW